jgi:ABC-type phosphate/phosphonate transport system substrate-binding protein/tRNA A-37 threonylcarbamoyl transferase component Bud32
MQSGKSCPKCGRPVPPDAPFGHCPNCLLGVGFAAQPESLPDATSTRVGDYELVEPIGHGAMAVVYKARQVSLNRIVALKMLNAHSSAFPALATRLKLEAEATANLHHPHIVTVYEVGEHEGQPFFSMELIEGTGLDNIMRAEGFPLSDGEESANAKRRGREAAIARLLSKLAWAVDHAHKHGVLHRDLKPANVLIDARGEPHLTDFGLAKVLHSESCTATLPGTVLGTASYMSPEQATGHTERVSTASDIYGLGATLYHMLTGRPPFKADTPETTLHQVIHEPAAPPVALNPSVDRDLATICMKCLEKAPQNRYSSAQALAEDLERFLRCEPIEARRPRASERIWRWCRREPKLAGLTAGVLFLLAAIGILTFVLYTREKIRRQQTLLTLTALVQSTLRDWAESHVRLDPHELALLCAEGSPAKGTELTVGVYESGEDPIRLAKKLYPLLIGLQRALREEDLIFGLRIYKSQETALEGFKKSEVDILRLTAAAYARIKDEHPEVSLVPLAQQQPSLQGAIFTRTDSGITRVEQLKGRTLVCPEPESRLGYDPAKAFLAEAGCCTTDFSLITTTKSRTLISAVFNKQFDAGVHPLGEIELAIKAGYALRIVASFESPGSVWVATPKLESLDAVKTNLTRMRSDVLAGLGFLRFEKLDGSLQEDLKKKMEAARRFDEPKYRKGKED